MTTTDNSTRLRVEHCTILPSELVRKMHLYFDAMANVSDDCADFMSAITQYDAVDVQDDLLGQLRSNALDEAAYVCEAHGDSFIGNTDIGQTNQRIAYLLAENIRTLKGEEETSIPVASPVASTLSETDITAKLNAAVDAEYPIPDNPHASVITRATDNRAAMWRGIVAARAIFEQAVPQVAAPFTPVEHITINGHQLKAALALAWPDGDADPLQGETVVNITRWPAGQATGENGEPLDMPAGLYLDYDDLPGEGMMHLPEEAENDNAVATN